MLDDDWRDFVLSGFYPIFKRADWESTLESLDEWLHHALSILHTLDDTLDNLDFRRSMLNHLVVLDLLIDTIKRDENFLAEKEPKIEEDKFFPLAGESN